MLIGTQYYRPPNPEPELWEECDRFMDLAEKNGLKAVIQLVPESHPEWVLRCHRDLRPRDAGGHDLGQAGCGMVAVGGYPGMFDEDCCVPRILPREPWSSAFGLRGLSRHYPSAPELTAEMDLSRSKTICFDGSYVGWGTQS